MLYPNDLVDVIYGHGPHPTDPNRHEEISEPAIFLTHQARGKAEVLCVDGHIVVCSTTRLRLRASVHDREYVALRASLFPDPQQQAA